MPVPAFKTDGAATRAENVVLNALQELVRPPTTTTSENHQSDSATPNSTAQKGTGQLLGLMGKLMQPRNNTSRVGVSQAGPWEILNTYLHQPNINLQEDPVVFWRQYSHSKELANLAQRFLCAPPSSVPSEWAFSTAGNICHEKRSRLGSDKVEMLLFIAKNVQQYKYWKDENGLVLEGVLEIISYHNFFIEVENKRLFLALKKTLIFNKKVKKMYYSY